MSRKAKFHVATLAAAVERANRIAPVKGAAYDRAAGIQMTVHTDGSVEIRATDLEVYYRERVNDVIEVGDEDVTWRFPSGLFAGLMGSLPPNGEVTFSEDKSNEKIIRIYCGKKRAKLRQMIGGRFPEWDAVDGADLKPVAAFGSRVGQVAWAADAQSAPFTGVNFDGERATATDRYKLAQVPLSMPLDEPVTVPMNALAPIFKNLPGEMRVGATDKELLITVGAEIEVRCMTYEQAYPKMDKPLRDNFTHEFKVPREELHETISQMLVLVKNERYPVMKFTFDVEEGTVLIHMSVPEVGEMEDTVEVGASVGDTNFELMFTPDYVMRALDAGTEPWMVWKMGPDPAGPNGMTLLTDGDYSAWVMPRQPGSVTQ